MTTLNKILLGGFILQALLAVGTWWPDSGPPEVQNLLGMSPEDIKSIRITGRKALDETPEAPVELVRGDSGWLIHTVGDYPATEAQMAPLLEGLGKLKAQFPIATQQATYTSLEVADDAFTRKIEIEGKDGSKRTLLVGVGQGKSAAVRVEGEDEVWSVSGVTAWTFGDVANRYFERDILVVDVETVNEVTITRPNTVPIVFRRDEAKLWTMPSTPEPLLEGQTLDQQATSTFISKLLNLRMADPGAAQATPEMGFDGPDVFDVTWTATAEGQSSTGSYRVGGVPATKSNRHYVRIEGKSWIFEVHDSNLEQAMKRSTTLLAAKSGGLGAPMAPGPGGGPHGGAPPGGPHGGAPPGGPHGGGGRPH